MADRVCVQFYPSHIRLESRITKTCATLSNSGLFDKVYFVGTTPDESLAGSYSHPLGFECMHFHRPITTQASLFQKILWTRKYEHQASRFAGEVGARVIGCRSVALLNLSTKLKKARSVKLMYDVHELETETLTSNGVKGRLIKQLEKSKISEIDGSIVVCDSIAEWYENKYRIPRPAVVRACPDTSWQKPLMNSSFFRDRFGISEQSLIFLYQGRLSSGRRISQYLDVFQKSSKDRHIVFMGYGPLEAEIELASKTCSRIHLHPAVPPDELLSYTASADVGLCGVENQCLSYYYSLPNKLLEYMHGGLAILCPDFPEMRKLVVDEACGTVHTEATSELTALVNSLSKAQIDKWAAGSKIASKKYTWQNEEPKLIEAYERLL